MNNDKLYFNELGDSFNHYMNDYDVQQRQKLIFDDLLSRFSFRDKRILEVGCGTGKFTQVIAKKGADLMVLDIGANLVKKVREEFNCEGVVGDACNLPFESNSYEGVISSECIEHTSEPIVAISEMCRICKPGGFVCITTPNKLWYPVLLLSLISGIRKFRGIENWIFPGKAKEVMKKSVMGKISLSGCHILPFQISVLYPLLSKIDKFGRYLYPVMIDFGICGVKKTT